MAAVSVSISRNGISDPMSDGESTQITFGVLAPNAGDIEIRISAAAQAAGITTNEVEEMLDVLWRALVQKRPSPLAGL